MAVYNNNGLSRNSIYDPPKGPILAPENALIILWLAVHGVPSRSIAFELQSLIPMKEGLNQTTAPQIELERHVRIIEEFVINSIDRLAGPIFKKCWGTGDFIDTIWSAIAKDDLLRGATIRIHRALEHALLDDGKEIIPTNSVHRATQQSSLYVSNPEDEEMFLLWRSIIGPSPRSSQRVPKRVRNIMSKRNKANDIQRWIDKTLSYTDGGRDNENVLMMQMMEKITRTGIIDRELPGPRPFSDYIGGKLNVADGRRWLPS
ncbi:hypothetical protein LTR84_009549 [Exophiala bonariae]|uniref:Uncharacterized protein n=1 Tax=Exophiala bonariae TaxID=1690606 RepID=A0AAV9MXI6_9EURO|nr:hypothetical protein LTR84_009549 [Exophiala bonariae]